MAIHQERTHPTPVDGCFGCKITTINFGTVPGAHKDSKSQISGKNKREKELYAYREARRAGEQPDNTTFKGIESARKKQEMWDKTEHVFADHNPPEVTKKLKKGYTNLKE